MKEQSRVNGIGFILFRCVVAFIIIITLTAVKFALPSVFKDVKEVYNQTFLPDVNAEYFLFGTDDKIAHK